MVWFKGQSVTRTEVNLYSNQDSIHQQGQRPDGPRSGLSHGQSCRSSLGSQPKWTTCNSHPSFKACFWISPDWSTSISHTSSHLALTTLRGRSYCLIPQKPRLRRFKTFANSHTASKGQIWDSSPRLSVCRTSTLSYDILQPPSGTSLIMEGEARTEYG